MDEEATWVDVPTDPPKTEALWDKSRLIAILQNVHDILINLSELLAMGITVLEHLP